ncbi:MAG TPA: DinB family protein [Chloroflexia bacterium]|nr:DinB family protein [Chloroflexia bacterium]
MRVSREELLKSFEQTLPTLQTLVAGKDDATLDFLTGTERWSIREILAHLVDDEMYVMRTRMERMIKEDCPTLAPHDEQKWFAQRNTSRDGLDQLLEDFALQRNASLGMLKMLRESDWQRPGHQPEYGYFSAEEWLGNWVEHDRVHIRQIEENLKEYESTR